MTTVTLPRATVEQALEALIIAWQQQPRWQITESMHNLRAAMAQEPQTTHSAECWRWHHKCAVAKIERECKHE